MVTLLCSTCAFSGHLYLSAHFLLYEAHPKDQFRSRTCGAHTSLFIASNYVFPVRYVLRLTFHGAKEPMWLLYSPLLHPPDHMQNCSFLQPHPSQRKGDDCKMSGKTNDKMMFQHALTWDVFPRLHKLLCFIALAVSTSAIFLCFEKYIHTGSEHGSAVALSPLLSISFK